MLLVDAIGIQATTEDAGGPPWLQIVLVVITSLTTIVTGLFAYMASQRSGRAESQLEVVAEGVKAVNKTVNNVPTDHPTLVQRVGILERRHDAYGRWIHDSLNAIGGQLGVALPDRREYDPEEGS